MIELLKEIALEAVDRGSLSDFCTGTIVSVAPLSIQIEMVLCWQKGFCF